jgi:hypothetical protein
MEKAFGFALKTAVAGLVLGLLGGILGGVEFGVLVLRMLISAIVAGALGAGGYFIVQKFLPELLTISMNEGDDSPLDPGLGGEMSAAGSTVDIVIDDDGPPAADQAGELRREMSDGESDADYPRRAQAMSEETPRNLFVEDENTIIEEVREDGAPAPQPSGGGREEEFDSDFSALPDIAGFSDSFNDGNFADEGEIPEGEMTPDSDQGSALSGFGGQETSFAQADSGSDDDPKILAQAIRTLMKKD